MFGIAFVCFFCGTYVGHWVCLFVGWVTYVWHCVCLFLVGLMLGIAFVCFFVGELMFGIAFVCYLWDLCWALGLFVDWVTYVW